jgi:glycosyltransferase involved in cell wall biosynthesis
MLFKLIGDGPLRTFAENFITTNQMKNVVLSDWLNPEKLRDEISRANLILGTFGNTPQALMTIQNKIWECLAMAKPIITGDSPVIRNTFINKYHLLVCNRNDQDSLVESIKFLKSNPKLCDFISQNGYEFYQENVTMNILGQRLVGYLRDLSKHQ